MQGTVGKKLMQNKRCIAFVNTHFGNTAFYLISEDTTGLQPEGVKTDLVLISATHRIQFLADFAGFQLHRPFFRSLDPFAVQTEEIARCQCQQQTCQYQVNAVDQGEEEHGKHIFLSKIKEILIFVAAKQNIFLFD